jgi:toxin ParE1/3/4
VARFELSERAKSDLAEIVHYSAGRWGTAQAEKYLDAIEARLDLLAKQPLLGRARENLTPGLFSFPIESHVAYYLRAAFGIVVVRVLHKRQDPYRHIG